MNTADNRRAVTAQVLRAAAASKDWDVVLAAAEELERAAENGEGKADPPQPYRMWAVTAPFRKNGTPVIGTMGASMERVVVMTAETFQRMFKDHSSLAKAVFELGDMDA